MVTYTELRSLICSYLSEETGNEVTPADLLINGVDLLNQAINSARRHAENVLDFLHSEDTVDLSIASTGTLLSSATLSGVGVKIKRVKEVLLPVAGSDYVPVEFITNETRLGRLKRSIGQSPYDSSQTLEDLGVDVQIPYAYQHGQKVILSPADQFTFPVAAKLEVIKFLEDYNGSARLTVSGATNPTAVNTTWQQFGTYLGFPLYFNFQEGSGPATTYGLWSDTAAWHLAKADSFPGIGSNQFSMTSGSQSPAGVYTAAGAFTGTVTVALSNATVASDFILENGWRFLQWRAILELNANIKDFVPRQEGNIDSAEIAGYASEAFSELAEWNRSLRDGTTTPEMIQQQVTGRRA
jgi:hypothetical protein